MKQTETHVVGNETYIIDQLPASIAFDIFIDTIKVVGPTAGPLVMQVFEMVSSGKFESFGDVDLRSLDLEKVAREFFNGLDKKQLRDMTKQLASVTTVVGKGKLSDLYEIHFGMHGMLQHMKWLICAYKVQFSDFFDALSKTQDSAKNDPA